MLSAEFRPYPQLTPFGEVEASTGDIPDLRFPGQWFMDESGLHQNWMRDYDPTTGRYLQADPLGLIDGPSVYGYVGQNPLRYVDPLGLQKVVPYVLPLSPDGVGPYWQNITHPKNPHPTFVRTCNPEEFIQFNKGDPTRGGHAAHDHWHDFKGASPSNKTKVALPPDLPYHRGGTHLPPGYTIYVTDCSCLPEEEKRSMPSVPPIGVGGFGRTFGRRTGVSPMTTPIGPDYILN